MLVPFQAAIPQCSETFISDVADVVNTIIVNPSKNFCVIRKFQLLIILSSKSLIYFKNNKGPNTDPCSTPLKTEFQFETSPSSTTRCRLSKKVLFYPVDYVILIRPGADTLPMYLDKIQIHWKCHRYKCRYRYVNFKCI